MVTPKDIEEPVPRDKAVLDVRHLKAGYKDLTAVWDVSLSVASGECCAVLGRNGAGKTTSLKAIAGLLPVSDGTVWFKGADISTLPAYERAAAGLGLVQEGKRIFRSRTVQENLLLGGYSLRRGRRYVRAAVEDACARFPVLGTRRGERAGALSGGQQQMLAIAVALMAQPAVLMLDEPSEGLAPVIVRDVFTTIRQLKAEGIGIILVEQASKEALTVADRVVVIERGRVSVAEHVSAFEHDLLLSEFSATPDR